MREDLPLRIANPNIHSKVFEDEVVIIDMMSGIYYSLRGAGVEMWTWAEAGATVGDVTAALAARYDAPANLLEQTARAFVGELVERGLIVADAAAPRHAPAAAAARIAFAPPLFERFTDMQDLLLLDPIHEVDEAGWPHVAAPTAEPH